MHQHLCTTHAITDGQCARQKACAHCNGEKQYQALAFHQAAARRDRLFAIACAGLALAFSFFIAMAVVGIARSNADFQIEARV